MTTRVYYYSEALTAGTANTTVTFTDQTSITISSSDASSSTWMVMGAGEVNEAVTGNYGQARLRHDTGSVTLANFARRPETASTEWQSFGFVRPITFGASPGNQTISLEYAVSTAGSGNATQMRNASLFAMKLTGNDTVNNPGTTPTSASTTFVDAASFTAPANGTYDVYGFAEFTLTASATGLPTFRFLLEDGSTAFRSTVISMADGPNTVPNNTVGMARVRRTLTTGQVVKVQFNKATGGGTITATHACAIGIDTGGFDSTQNAVDSTSRNTASAAYVQRNAASDLTFTPSATSPWVWVGFTAVDVSSQTATNSAGVRASIDGSNYQNTIYVADAGANDIAMIMGLREQSLSNASHTASWTYGQLAAMTVTSPYGDWVAYQLDPGSTAWTGSAALVEDSAMTTATILAAKATAALVEDSTLTVGALLNRGPLDELVDDFSGGLGQWTVGTSGATIVSSHLDLPYSSGVTKTIASADLWDAEGSRILVRMSDVLDTGQVGMRLADGFNATNYIDMYVATGILKARISASGVTTTTTIDNYSAANHAWWQIAKAAATWVLYVSPSGIDASWSPVASFPTVWTADNVYAEFWTIGA